jgi:histidinol-phosphatase
MSQERHQVDLNWYRHLESVGLRALAALVPHALSFYETELEVETKPDRSLVSAADRALEAKAKGLLRSLDPDVASVSGFFGEETGHLTRLLPEGTHGVGEHRPLRGLWILDPIDGTTAFLAKVPTWGILLAYIEDSRPVVGIMCFPALNEIYCASLGSGAVHGAITSGVAQGQRPTRRCRVSGCQSLDEAFVTYSSPSQYGYRGLQPFWQTLAGRCRELRTLSDAFGYARVLTGAVDAMHDCIAAPYDLAAIEILARETPGAVVRSFCFGHDNPVFSGGGMCVAASAPLADAMESVLQESVDHIACSDQTPWKSADELTIGSNSLRSLVHQSALVAARKEELPLQRAAGLAVRIRTWRRLVLTPDSNNTKANEAESRSDASWSLEAFGLREKTLGSEPWPAEVVAEGPCLHIESPMDWKSVQGAVVQVFAAALALFKKHDERPVDPQDVHSLALWPQFKRDGWSKDLDRFGETVFWESVVQAAARVARGCSGDSFGAHEVELVCDTVRTMTLAGDDLLDTHLYWTVVPLASAKPQRVLCCRAEGGDLRLASALDLGALLTQSLGDAWAKVQRVVEEERIS